MHLLTSARAIHQAYEDSTSTWLAGGFLPKSQFEQLNANTSSDSGGKEESNYRIEG